MSDEELDSHLRRLTAGNPLLGQRNVLGLLAAEGHIVQRDRVAASLARVDPAAVAMRWSRTIHRRSYSVAGPNALWHIDGNHKLIRYVYQFGHNYKSKQKHGLENEPISLLFVG